MRQKYHLPHPDIWLSYLQQEMNNELQHRPRGVSTTSEHYNNYVEAAGNNGDVAMVILMYKCFEFFLSGATSRNPTCG